MVFLGDLTLVDMLSLCIKAILKECLHLSKKGHMPYFTLIIQEGSILHVIAMWMWFRHSQTTL